MKTILLADDHAIMREGLRRILLEKFPDYTILEAGNHAEILNIIRKHPVHLVILDISMPGYSGLETLSVIRENTPALPVLILSMYPESQFAARVMKAGAAGYLNKESSPNELTDAVETILRGERYLTAKVADALVNFINEPDGELRHKYLSNREFQVLQLFGRGLTATDIARQLNLSVKTISTYRSHILSKLGLKNTSGIIAYAIRNDLVA